MNNKIVTFLVVIIIYLLTGMEADIVIPCYPEFQKVFNLTPARVQLTLSINFAAYCIGSIYAGTLGDKYGTKSIIIYGLIVFVLGCIICILSNNFVIILISRILQGLVIAAPSILGRVSLFNVYSKKEYAVKLGFLHSYVTMGMAIAPTLGSYLNIYYGWRGGFILLIVLGIICLIISKVYLPNDNKSDFQKSFSLTEYINIIQSKLFWKLSLTVCSLLCCYCIYIGMGPIIYMQGMKVSLKKFGLYQGSIAAGFIIMNFFSSIILKKWDHWICLQISALVNIVCSIILLFVTMFINNNAILFTLCIFSCCMSAVCPVNIIYAKILSFNKNTSKVSAILTIMKLICAGIGVEILSYFYVGRLLELGVTLFLLYTLSSFTILTPSFKKIFK